MFKETVEQYLYHDEFEQFELQSNRPMTSERKISRSPPVFFISELKCMTRNFLLAYLKELLIKIEEEWSLFYCDSTLGCRRVIEDFDLRKLDDV